LSATGNRKVKVLWLIKGLGAGGAERLLWMFCLHGDRKAFDYHVAYVVPGANAMVPAINETHTPVHCLNGGGFMALGWPFRLRRLLVDEHFDVVHVHSPFVAALLRIVALTLRPSRRPILVSTEHCTWWSYRVETRLLNALTCRMDRARFAVSNEVLASMWPGMRARVEVLVHGILLSEVVQLSSRHRQDIRAALGVGQDDLVVTTVANYRGQKAYGDMLLAARAVLDADDRVRFWAVGYGPLEREVRHRHQQLELGHRFQLLGYRADVLHVLKASDVFAMASVYEGGPIAVLEAMAVGLPVVVTSVGFVPDVVSDGVDGFVVPPADPALLSAKLLELLSDDPLRRRMAAAAEQSGRKYDVSLAVARVEAVYLSVLTTAGTRAAPAGNRK
jgi:glycosyltransferase involved in cell wall biosynthesis